jgi:ribonuclease-3
MDELVEKLGLSRCPKLLRLALTHPSAVGKGAARIQNSNQRLVFMGDAILGGVIALHLYRNLPNLNEGELTLCKISIVRKESLAAAAKRLDLGKHLILGSHEEAAGGRNRDSILADALEAVIAAIYLSQGQKAATETVLKVLSVEITAAAKKPLSLASSKNILQEKTQALGLGTPIYQTAQTSGDSFPRFFHAQVLLGEKVMGEGSGGSKKLAEAEAANAAIVILSSSPLKPNAE